VDAERLGNIHKLARDRHLWRGGTGRMVLSETLLESERQCKKTGGQDEIPLKDARSFVLSLPHDVASLIR
jgi:hypothetical protein